MTKSDFYLMDLNSYLMKKYGVLEAERDISPLAWYINTGRAPTEFLKALYKAKIFMIARKLHAGGSYQDAINRIKKYLGF